MLCPSPVVHCSYAHTGSGSPPQPESRGKDNKHLAARGVRANARTALLLNQFDLLELELDGGCTTEDRHADLDPATIEIEFLDHAIEAGERAIEDLYRIADL